MNQVSGGRSCDYGFSLVLNQGARIKGFNSSIIIHSRGFWKPTTILFICAWQRDDITKEGETRDLSTVFIAREMGSLHFYFSKKENFETRNERRRRGHLLFLHSSWEDNNRPIKASFLNFWNLPWFFFHHDKVEIDWLLGLNIPWV